MKLFKALTAAAATAALVIPFGGGLAGAVTTTDLTVVDAYQYDADDLMDHTICLDDTVVHDGSQVITSGISTTPGSHTIVVNDAPGDCTVGKNSLTGTVTLADTPAQTLVVNWPDWGNEANPLSTTLFTDDLSCTAADTGRIVFRNVASYDGFVGIFGSDNGTAKTPLISDIAVSTEGVESVPAGSFPGAGSTVAGWDSVTGDSTASEFTSLSIPAGSVSSVYAIGGNDGTLSMFEVTRSGSVCETTPTTTTVPKTTTTTTAPPAIDARAATPVASQPTYTG